jgi:hypothetical protein
MKLPAFAAALLGMMSLQAHSAVSPIHMDVEQHSSTKAPKAKPGHPALSGLTQHRSLTIKLSNNSSESFDNLVVKYFFIGHDLKDRKLVVLQQGQRKSSLAPRGKDTVDSEEVTNIYTEAHSETSKSKGGKGGKGKSKGRGVAVKRIPASGKKVIGYAVLLMNGNKVEAEAYSEPSYKEIAARGGPSQTGKSGAKKSGAKKSASKTSKKKK